MKNNKLKKITSCALCFLTAVSAFCLSAIPAHAENPTIQTIYTPDPAPMVYNDTFYFYTGHDADNSSYFTMVDWHCYSTTDMKNWVDHGEILSYEDFDWAEENSCWAAQCIERDGKFYMYVTLTDKNGGGRAIGVAVSDSPTGPFKDAIGKPLCGPNWLYIDPTVFIDDDGQAYLYFGNPKLHYVKLKDNMIECDGEVTEADMTADQFGPSLNDAPSGYTEGPWIYKRNGIYYMLYAASGIPETIDYSTSDSPIGPWKYQGRIMDNSPTSFTIHPGIIEYKDHAYFTYHNGDLEGGGGFTRSGAIEEFTFGKDGSIPHIDPTKEGPDQLEYFNPYVKNEAETICYAHRVETKRGENGEIYVTELKNNDYIKVAGVNFSDKATSFTASVSAPSVGGSIEIRLDSPDGKLVGTVEVPVTGGEEAWQEVTCEISGASGVHDLYFAFVGERKHNFNFDWWKFDGIYDEADYTKRPVLPSNSGISAVLPIAITAAAVVMITVRRAKNKKN